MGYVGSSPFGFVWDRLGVGCDYELVAVTSASVCNCFPYVGGSWLACGGYLDGDGGAGRCLDEDVWLWFAWLVKVGCVFVSVARCSVFLVVGDGPPRWHHLAPGT